MIEAILAVTAWIAIVVQLGVVPFFGKAPELFKEYVQSGELALVRSRMEEHKVLPPLATLFEQAMKAQGDRRKRMQVKDLLQGVDFFATVEELVSAAADIGKLDRYYQELHSLAPKVSTAGLVHCAATALLLPCYWLAPTEAAFAWGWRLLAMALLGLVWFGTLSWLLRRYGRYRTVQADFITCLSRGREVSGDS